MESACVSSHRCSEGSATECPTDERMVCFLMVPDDIAFHVRLLHIRFVPYSQTHMRDRNILTGQTKIKGLYEML